MQRTTRSLLFIGLIAVAGVVALGMLAKRYASFGDEPLRSVADVEAAQQAPAGLPPAQPAGTNAEAQPAVGESAAPAAPAGAAAAPAGPAISPEAQAMIETFLVGRRALLAEMEAHPKATERLKEEMSSGVEWDAGWSGKHIDVVLRFKVARVRALNEHGASEEAYHRVRKAFVAWQGGEAVDDAGLLAAFEARRDELQPLWLDVYEAFDEM